MTETNNVSSPENTSTEKKAWVTPAATAETVAEVTKNSTGPGADAINCHS